MIVRTVCTGAFQENCYLAADSKSKEAFIIDPGEGVDEIAEAVERDGLKPVAITNTHAHIDHIAGVEALKEKYSIPFWLHKDDAFWLDEAPNAAAMFGLTFGKIPKVDRWLKPGETLECGSLRFRIGLAPGHTPGHLLFVGEGAAFVGDVLFPDSIGRTDLPGGDYATLIRSIRRELLPLPDETVVYAGHMEPTTIGKEKRTNPFILNPEAYGRVEP